jgi:hypothetical protein
MTPALKIYSGAKFTVEEPRIGRGKTLQPTLRNAEKLPAHPYSIKAAS